MPSSISRVIVAPFLNHDFAIDRQIGGKLAAFEQFVDTLVALLAQDTNFVLKVASQAIFFFLLDRQLSARPSPDPCG